MKPPAQWPRIAGLALALYLLGFVLVHRSWSLRKPAANMMYWYYSDNPIVEDVEFYGFWPLRQLVYGVPGFEARHSRERTSPPRLSPGL
jgi:hypothetical protein